MSIRSKIEALKETVPSNVKIVAVSKFHSNEEIMEAYNAGQRLFGESRVQELVQKQQELPKDMRWCSLAESSVVHNIVCILKCCIFAQFF
jgi:uncharacterized pyridoxal phosphate-containing UPF0001 family protein